MSEEQKRNPLSLNAIRDIIKAMNHKHITPKNPIEFQQCINLLTYHPTWKDKLDTIECIKITPSKMNNNLILMKIKPSWCQKYITISWRKCYQTKSRVPKNPPPIKPVVMNTSQSIETDPVLSTSMISDADIDMFQSNGLMSLSPSLENSVEMQVDPSNTVPLTSSSTTDVYKKLTGAMRYSIRKQIRDFQKQHRLNRQCRNCSSLLHLQVDHCTVPFVDIQKNFLKHCEEKSISIPTTFNFSRSTCQPKFKKIDIGFNRRWQNFHKKHADFQWLCKTCNLKKGKKIK